MAAITMRRFTIAIGILLFALPAWPREADGRLGLLLLPNDARPALVLRGQTFTVVTRAPAILSLESSVASHDISVAWVPIPGGLLQGTCTLPQDVPAGPLTLQAKTESISDQNPRSVFVYDEFPKSYSFAHLSDLRTGPADRIDIAETIRSLEAQEIAFVLVTGQLSLNGTADQMAQALSAFANMQIPVFICPGPAEMSTGHFESFLGPMPYAFRFGEDGYIGHYLPPADTSDISGRAATLHRLRRSIRASRWSVGFLNDYGAHDATRDQLVLFRDDPLDYIVSSHQALEFSIPWGRTIGFGTTGTSADVQIFDVDPVRIHMRNSPEKK